MHEGELPQYQIISVDIARRIEAGELPVGERLYFPSYPHPLSPD